MRSKNLPTNELGLNSEGKEIVEAGTLPGWLQKIIPIYFLFPFEAPPGGLSSCFDLPALGASNHIPRSGR